MKGGSSLSDTITLITDSEVDDLAQFFKIFGDPTRLRIMHMLLESEKCVGDIAEGLSMEQSAISHQLRILKQMKLVVAARAGKQIHYSLADDHIAHILTMGLDHIREEE